MPRTQPPPAAAGLAPPQLDLFADSDETQRHNDVLLALQQRDEAAATAALQRLALAWPQHDTLAALASLIAALGEARDTQPWPGHDALAAARQHLAHTVVPAARRLLGDEAGAWLAPLWQHAAQRAHRLPLDAAWPEDHAAPLWLLAGDAAAAVQAVQAILSWRRQPLPLAWMVEARHRLQGLDSTWPLLAELAWLAPARLASLVPRLADPLLTRLVRRFEDEFDPDAPGPGGVSAAPLAGPASHPTSHPVAWLPAWLLIEQPALLARLREARRGQDTAPEQAFRLLAELLGLEQQGRQADALALRKRLRDHQPALLAAYLRRR